MGNVIIQSMDDLFGFMALTLTGEASWDDVDLDRLHVTIPIRVYGPTRDGRIDPPGARLIQDLQRHAAKAFRDIGDTTTGGRSTELRVSVQENCDFWNIDATKLVKEAISRMSGKQITATLCIFLFLGSGYFAFSKYQDTQLEMLKINIAASERVQIATHEEHILDTISDMQQRSQDHEKMIVEKLAVSQESIEIICNYAIQLLENAKVDGEDSQLPIRRFTKTMRKGETISLDGKNKLSKREAIEKIGKKHKDDSLYHVHADGEYEIAGLDLMGKSQGLRVKRGGEDTFVILERLDAGIKDGILRAVDKSMETKAVQRMELQVDVYFKSSGVQYGVVIGVGPERHGFKHYSLSEIPHSIPASGWLLAGTKD
jgi:hypothetical protein